MRPSLDCCFLVDHPPGATAGRRFSDQHQVIRSSHVSADEVERIRLPGDIVEAVRRRPQMRRREFLVETSRSAIGFALVPAVLRSQTSAAVPDAAQLIADLEHEIPRTMEDTRVPGLSIAVVRDAKLFWRRGFGVRRAGSPERVDHDTVFDAGSVSKPVFADAG